MKKIIIDNDSNNLVINAKDEESILLESLNDIKVNISIVIAKNANVLIIENNVTNVSVDLNILNNSFVKYQSISTKVSNEEKIVKMNRDSNLEFIQINTNEAKSNFTVDLLDENANVNAKYLCIGKDFKQEINSTINHKAMHTDSLINNIGISLENNKILFNTIGKIENGFAKSNCSQLSKGVIVGDNAKVTTRPILLIDEHDVKAYHGATIGKMSDDELFYLMSRGISKSEAFLLILSGLINPILSMIMDEDLKQEVIKKANELIG